MTLVAINAPWGVLSECLSYSKMAAEPRVCPRLRQRFCQVLARLANLLPAPAHRSSLDAENNFCLQRPRRGRGQDLSEPSGQDPLKWLLGFEQRLWGGGGGGWRT